ncbi:hypothetical protein ONS95_000971 [Cadophora gregata]|uniref:uncharacterized protein n=1 Tax=Cadophora gregata TaxID=51156 RepID=UPI0026DC9817|nr:uncharacterized protein ONS95_000971 [Cadophora gregata]KAK0102831.1 hypothetical protein ONS96_005463 [Cadophora gregata f. sp. sojae]KAK0129031.1 hypothetical protein ONS95_000971 [Cadophora gregata]
MDMNRNLSTAGSLIYIDPSAAKTWSSTANSQHIYQLAVLRSQTANNRHNAQFGAATKIDIDQVLISYLTKTDANSEKLQSTAYVSPYPTTPWFNCRASAAQPPTNPQNVQQSLSKKKVRTAYGPMVRWKYEVLEASFKKNETPSAEEIHRIMEKTGMDWRKVTKHFSDKRSRMRKLGLIQRQPQREVQAESQLQSIFQSKTIHYNFQRPEFGNNITDQVIAKCEECTACIKPMIQRKIVRAILPAPDALPRYISMGTSAITKSIQQDIDHEKRIITILDKDVARMERDHFRFGCVLEMVNLQRIAHQARTAGLTFMLQRLRNASDLPNQNDTTSSTSFLADLDASRLCLSTSKILAKAQFQSIVNKLKEHKKDALRMVEDLQHIVSQKSVCVSKSQLQGYRIFLVEWQARCLVYRLALVSFIATYYDSEERVITHSSE